MVLVATWMVIAHSAFPADHPLHISAFWMTLLGKFLCFAMLALAMDLIWGYTGILSLGQGLFFALGGYLFGMYLMRQIGRDGVYQSDLPDFMVFLDWKALPWYWSLSDSFAATLVLIVAVPGLVAAVFGNDMGFGGNNGFTDFKRILDYPIAEPIMRSLLLALSALALVASYFFCRAIVNSRAGQVLTAIRESEARLLFIGYRSVHFKLFAWVVAAIISAIAGALYVPQVGIINPSEMSPAQSIEIAIWAAIGGRGSLIGPILGAFAVNGAKSWFTVAFPQLWLFVLGFVFVAVTLILPKGMIGLIRRESGSLVIPWRKT
jgi:urea transport system permease protein